MKKLSCVRWWGEEEQEREAKIPSLPAKCRLFVYFSNFWYLLINTIEMVKGKKPVAGPLPSRQIRMLLP